MIEIYDILQAKGVLYGDTIKLNKIKKLSKTKLIDICQSIVETPSFSNPKITKSLYTHAASTELSGSTGCCKVLECRQFNLDQLARFAVIYSDRVYIHNFISDICCSQETDLEYLQKRFYDDLLLLLHIRPLLESGLFVILSPENHTCPKCFLHQFKVSKDLEKRIFLATRLLAKDFFTNSEISIQLKHDLYGIRCYGLPPYYEHGGIVFVNKVLPEPFKNMPRLIKKLHNESIINISKNLKKKTEFHKVLAEAVATNVCFGLATSKILNATFVTNNSLHTSFLKTLTDDIQMEKQNTTAFKYLTTCTPFLGEVSNQNILKIRQREQESFIIFRKAINDIIQEFRFNPNMTKSHAEQLYKDVIESKLALLDRKIKNAKKDLLAKAAHAVLGTVASLSFGILTGFVNTKTAAVAAALGLPKIAADIEKILAAGDAEKTVRNEDMYFLWKVRNLKS